MAGLHIRGISMRRVIPVVAAVVIVAGISVYALHSQRPSNAAVITSNPAPASLVVETADTNVSPGSVLSATIYEHSLNVPVNVVQVALTYPQDKLEFVSLAEGTVFTNVASTDTSQPGTVRLARALPAASAGGTSGRHKVAVMNFRVLAAATGTIDIGLDRNNSFLVSATDNKNIIDDVAGISLQVRR